MSARLTLRPGSAAWLLAHECRLFFYEMGGAKDGRKGKRGIPYFGLAMLALLAALLHWGAWLLLRALPPLHATPPLPLVAGVSVAMGVAFTLMLSLALSHSVRALFERGDLDLLLSSPLSSHTIFTVRLAGVVCGVALMFLALLSPLAHVGLLLGQPRWLGIYPALLGMATFAAALAMLLTLVLVRWLGVRRTRTVAQLLGALTGASVFLISQVFGNANAAWRERAFSQAVPWLKPGGWLAHDSWAWLPGRALFGSPADLLVWSAAALGLFWLTARLTHHFFVRGVQQAGAVAAPLPARVEPVATARLFRTGIWRTIVQKEWRLIARDPQLISHVGLQLLYLAPLLFVFFKGQNILPGVAAAMTFLSASLAGSLAWIIVAAEDAPDLLLAAPVSTKTVRHAKLLAATLPVLALLAPALLWLAWRTPLFALELALICAAAIASAAQIQVWLGKPASRSQFNRRKQGDWGAGLLEGFSSMAWAGGALLAGMGNAWAAAALALALVLTGAAWLIRLPGKR